MQSSRGKSLRELFVVHWAYNRLQIAALILVGLIGSLIFVSAQYFLMLGTADEMIRRETDTIFARTEAIARSNITTFARLQNSPNPPCTPADLNDMRGLVFDTMYLADVGRMVDGQVGCTALWGTLPDPPALPEPDRISRANGVSLWWDEVGLVPLKAPVNLVALGSSIVFIPQWIFRDADQVEPEVGLLVESRDRAHVQREIGNTQGLAEEGASSSRWYVPGQARHSRRCSDQYDVCVVGRYLMPNPLLTAPAGFAGALFGGFLTGAALAAGFVYLLNRRMPIRQQLSRALQDDRLAVVYQPIVDLDTGALTGAEALVRLVDLDGQWIAPDRFIGAAETMGLIGLISRSVTRRALRDMRDYLQGGDFYISINVSVLDFMDPEFRPFLEAEADELGIDRRQIALELTERETADHQVLAEVLGEYRRSGFQILIDDFGTGYSSLAYIERLPISGIKVDKMFVQGLGRSPIGGEVVKEVIVLAAALDVRLICEGVETRAQADILGAMRSGLSAQGWLYGKAVELDDFRKAAARAG